MEGRVSVRRMLSSAAWARVGSIRRGNSDHDPVRYEPVRRDPLLRDAVPDDAARLDPVRYGNTYLRSAVEVPTRRWLRCSAPMTLPALRERARSVGVLVVLSRLSLLRGHHCLRLGSMVVLILFSVSGCSPPASSVCRWSGTPAARSRSAHPLQCRAFGWRSNNSSACYCCL